MNIAPGSRATTTGLQSNGPEFRLQQHLVTRHTQAPPTTRTTRACTRRSTGRHRRLPPIPTYTGATRPRQARTIRRTTTRRSRTRRRRPIQTTRSCRPTRIPTYLPSRSRPRNRRCAAVHESLFLGAEACCPRTRLVYCILLVFFKRLY